MSSARKRGPSYERRRPDCERAPLRRRRGGVRARGARAGRGEAFRRTSPTAPPARRRWRSSSRSRVHCPSRPPGTRCRRTCAAACWRRCARRRKRMRPFGRRRRARGGRPSRGAERSLRCVVAVILAFALSSGGSSTRMIQASTGSAELRIAGGHGDLIVHRLPQLPAGRIYQMWVQRGTATPRPTGTLFGVTPSGSATVGVPGQPRRRQRGDGHAGARGGDTSAHDRACGRRARDLSQAALSGLVW